MNWLTLGRKPEPAVRGDAEGVETHASVAAQAHADVIANMLIDQVQPLGRTSGWLVDIGMVSSGIPLEIARCLANLRGVGISRSDTG